jgi:hypothetical protein
MTYLSSPQKLIAQIHHNIFFHLSFHSILVFVFSINESNLILLFIKIKNSDSGFKKRIKTEKLMVSQCFC